MPYTQLGDLQTLTLADNVECDNPCCILTLNCTVLLMGNMTLTNYVSGNTIATLPESMRPLNPIWLHVFLNTNSRRLMIKPDGTLSIPNTIASATLYLNGITFNVCDRYYNGTIGNNFPQGTSPLRWDGEDY